MPGMRVPIYDQTNCRRIGVPTGDSIHNDSNERTPPQTTASPSQAYLYEWYFKDATRVLTVILSSLAIYHSLKISENYNEGGFKDKFETETGRFFEAAMKRYSFAAHPITSNTFSFTFVGGHVK